jgi:hypothetical protein
MNTRLFAAQAQEQHKLTEAKRAGHLISWGDGGRSLFHVNGDPVGYPSHITSAEQARDYAAMHNFDVTIVT